MARGGSRARGDFRGAPARGGPPRGRGGGRGRGRGRGRGGYVPMDEFDFPIQQWPDGNPPPARGTDTPRGRGRGRGNGSPYESGFASPRRGTTPWRGFDTPPRGMNARGRGRGRGDSDYDPRNRGRGGRNMSSMLRSGAPLSKLLYQDRPYLRPVIFVRSVHTAILFQEEEEILQPVVESAADDEESHVPTADKVASIFSGRQAEEAEEAEEAERESFSEELEEIDFADLSKIQAEVDAAAATVTATKENTATAISLAATTITTTADTETLEEIDFAEIGKVQAEVDAAATASTVTNATAASEKLEEIDFADMGKVQAEVDAAAATTTTPTTTSSHSTTETAVHQEQMQTDVDISTVEEKFTGFYIDTTPSAPTVKPDTDRIAVDRVEGVLGGEEEQDEVIVYVAPHPRSGRATSATDPKTSALVTLPQTSILGGTSLSTPLPIPGPSTALSPLEPPSSSAPPAPAFSSISFSFGTTPRRPARKLVPAGSARALKRRGVRRRPLGSFGLLGAARDEAVLRGGRARDPRAKEQRRGDSDVDWGDSDSDSGEKGAANAGDRDEEELSNGVGAMDLDADIDFDAMRSFVKGMSAGGSRHVTMDDLADAERIRREDEEATRGGAGTGQSEESEEEGEDEDDEENSEDDDEEVERILGTQERTLIAEDDGSVNDTSDEDEEGEEGSSDDDDESPRRGFQARLERMRKKAEGKRPAVEEQDDSSDEAMSVHITWADEDDDFIASLEELLDDNADILLGNGKTRKQRKKLFRSVRNGEFDHDMYEEMMSPAKRMKDKDIPPELREQWERDRQKKAENKRLRAQARLELAADPLAEHKGGKKGRKAMLAAARLDPSADLPNRVTNLVTLEQQIRRFLDDVGGRETMVLPPASKEMRKRIHELASAFNLKSQSKGSGATRYTTLIKMTRSGIGINEKKVRRILKEADPSWIAPDWDRGRGKGKGVALPQHREGEVVGKAAPKIGESNVGFKMLAAMGWAEGDRIGLSGGLDAPLTAVIKKTKLGLGATL